MLKSEKLHPHVKHHWIKFITATTCERTTTARPDISEDLYKSTTLALSPR